MDGHDWSVVLYALNFSLLVAHQIDSAYWEEWELFHFPGGIQINLLLNLALLLGGIAGFGLLVDHRLAGDVFSLVLAAGGIFAFSIHTFFLLRGDHRFRTPVSLALLVSMLLVSPLQAAVVLA